MLPEQSKQELEGTEKKSEEELVFIDSLVGLLDDAAFTPLSDELMRFAKNNRSGLAAAGRKLHPGISQTTDKGGEGAEATGSSRFCEPLPDFLERGLHPTGIRLLSNGKD